MEGIGPSVLLGWGLLAWHMGLQGNVLQVQQGGARLSGLLWEGKRDACSVMREEYYSRNRRELDCLCCGGEATPRGWEVGRWDGLPVLQCNGDMQHLAAQKMDSPDFT